MPRGRAPYPEEFRRRTVELVRRERNPEELARERCGFPASGWLG
ncbi:MAG: hypothetical protein WEF99_14875 [Thermoanaerobaculia bacterium]